MDIMAVHENKRRKHTTGRKGETSDSREPLQLLWLSASHYMDLHISFSESLGVGFSLYGLTYLLQ